MVLLQIYENAKNNYFDFLTVLTRYTSNVFLKYLSLDSSGYHSIIRRKALFAHYRRVETHRDIGT